MNLSRNFSLRLFIAFSILFFYFLSSVQAAWNGSHYNPGATLNPECSANQSGCTVKPPLVVNTTCSDDQTISYDTSSGLWVCKDDSVVFDSIAAVTSTAMDDLLAVYDTSSGSVKKVTKSNFLLPVLGSLNYQGTWDASVSATPGTCNSDAKGMYYIASVAGNGYALGDWAICNGTTWDKLENASAVTSIFGRTGLVVAEVSDYDANQIDNTAYGEISSTNVQSALNELDDEKLADDLFSGRIFVGNSSNEARGVILSGDGRMNNAGELTIWEDAVELGNDTTGDYVEDIAVNSGLVKSGTEKLKLAILLDGTTLQLGASGISINLDNANTWNGVQTFTEAIVAPTATDTINGLVVSGGMLTEVNGITFTSGNLDMATGVITNIGSTNTNFNAAGGLQLANDLTMLAGNADINMNNNVVRGIGNANTYFTATGGLYLNDDIYMYGTGANINANNNVILNIGSADTDFSATGGLQLADDLIMKAGGADINMNSNVILNIGSADTDFSATGGLQLADDLIMKAGGADINMNANVIQSIGDANTFFNATGGLQLADDLTMYTGADIDMNNNVILNIGSADTFFSATGGLQLADDITMLAGGSANINMNNNVIVGIGNVDTFFNTLGGLQLADELTMKTGGLANIDMNRNTIRDIGNDETEFNSTGGLQLADDLTFFGDGANIQLGSNYLSGDGDDEGIFVNGSGRVGIGTGNPTLPLTVSSTVSYAVSNYGYLTGSGATGYNGSSSGTNPTSLYVVGRSVFANEVQVTSDQRLKNLIDHIQPEVALNAVKDLDLVHFVWKPETEKGDSVIAGVFAQQVQEVIPEAVTSQEGLFYDDERTVNYDMLTTYSLAAIQGLAAETDANTSNIVALDLATQNIADAQAGLDFTTNQWLTNLSEELASQDQTIESISQQLALLETKTSGLELSLDLTELEVSGGATFKGNVEFQGPVVFRAIAQFIDSITFKKDATFEDTATFNKQITVKKGIEIEDQATGDIYCSYIENGENKIWKGSCADLSLSETEASPSPSPQTEDQVEEVVEEPQETSTDSAAVTVSIYKNSVDMDTTELKTSLSSLFDNFEFTEGVYEASYSANLVLDLSGNQSELLQGIIDLGYTEIDSLPEGENSPNSDLLLIVAN